ncbi:MAG: hypothetical protein V7K88_28610 [Nostoc sp.]|uniref:hypothetical protein n=1 Tax=Nostoc sp. TaxID=1180 RepID=UPI002FF5904C
MPKGIITQFIVAIHELINEQQCVWKSGVVLSKDQTKAEVIEYYGKREIKIRVSGRHKRDLMTIVTYELDKIHDSYKRLKYNKLIPCNCGTCKHSQEPYFYPFERLQKFRADKQERIQCQKSYQMVDVLGLIDDVIGRRELLKVEQQMSGNSLPNYSVTIGGNVRKVIIQPSNPDNNSMTKPYKQEETSKSEYQVTLPWAYRNGMFYLLVFAIVFNTVGIFAGILPIYSLALVIIGTVLFIVIIGVLQLRGDDRLSEKSFVVLTKMVLEQLPLIGNIIKQFQGNK